MIFNHSGMSSDANWCLVQKSDDVLKRFSESFVNLSGASISHQPQYGGSLREGGGGGFARPNFGGIWHFNEVMTSIVWSLDKGSPVWRTMECVY